MNDIALALAQLSRAMDQAFVTENPFIKKEESE